MPSERTITVESTEPLSPHQKAVHEAGASLLKDSVETGREFCKSMISTSLTAVPVYVGLVQLFVPEKKILPDVVGVIWLVPAALFLSAAGVFAAGYVPGRSQLSLDLPSDVEKTLSRAINRRYWLGLVGFVLLSSGIVAGIAVLGTMGTQ